MGVRCDVVGDLDRGDGALLGEGERRGGVSDGCAGRAAAAARGVQRGRVVGHARVALYITFLQNKMQV